MNRSPLEHSIQHVSQLKVIFFQKWLLFLVSWMLILTASHGKGHLTPDLRRRFVSNEGCWGVLYRRQPYTRLRDYCRPLGLQSLNALRGEHVLILNGGGQGQMASFLATTCLKYNRALFSIIKTTNVNIVHEANTNEKCFLACKGGLTECILIHHW